MGRKRKRSPQAPGSAASTPSQKRPKKNGETPSKPAPQADLRSLAGPFQADLTKEERAREAALYKTLGSELEADRLAAADIIIESLLGTSSSRPGSGSDAGRTTNNGQAQGPTATTDAPSAAVPSTPAPVPVPEPVLERHLDRRLFRGLASGANASRIGFSLVLTEVLERLFKRDGLAGTTYPGLTFDRVLGLLVSNTQVTGAAGSVTGQEERDHHFGRLFGLECFVRANILFGSHSSSSSSGSGKEKRWKKVLDLLLALANTKVWLRPQCGWMIVQAVHHAGMRAKEARRTLRALADAGLAETPEGVAVWLACVSRFPEIADGVSEDGESDKWRNPMAPSSLDRLAAILKDGGRQHQQQTSDAGGDGERAAKKQSQSNWTAQLHFVWDLIRAYFVRMELDDERSALTSFRLFWNRVVDGR